MIQNSFFYLRAASEYKNPRTKKMSTYHFQVIYHQKYISINDQTFLKWVQLISLILNSLLTVFTTVFGLSLSKFTITRGLAVLSQKWNKLSKARNDVLF